MNLFLDTANIAAIRKVALTGLIDGVTTNPTHLSKEGGSPLAVIKQLCALLPDGEISVEVTETEPQKVFEQAREIAAIAENVVVKIPCAPEYYEIISKLVNEGVPLNITLVFSVSQALMLAKLGVVYISVFVGRLDDSGVDGLEVLATIREMLDEYDFDSMLLAASIRSVEHFEQAAVIGVDAVTITPELFEQAIQHELTVVGMQKFAADWQQLAIDKFP